MTQEVNANYVRVNVFKQAICNKRDIIIVK